MTGPLVVLGDAQRRRRGAQPAAASWAGCRAGALARAGHRAGRRTLPAARCPTARPSSSWSAPRCWSGSSDSAAGGPRCAAADHPDRGGRPAGDRLCPGALPQVLRGRDLRRAHRAAAGLALPERALERRGPGPGGRRCGEWTAKLSRGLGWLGSRLQTGQVGSTSCSSWSARCGSSTPWSGDRR